MQPDRHTSRTLLSAVGTGRDTSTSSSPVGVVVLALGVLVGALSWEHTESVGTEVVSLGLEETGGEDFCAVAVVEGQGSREGGEWDTEQDTLCNDSSPSVLSLVDGLVEEVVEEQVLELWGLAVGVGDVLEEDGSDDAATSPHGGNVAVVELPSLLLGCCVHEDEALRVGDDLGGIQSLLEVVNKLLLVALEWLDLWAGKDLGGAASLLLEGGKAAGEDGLTNECDGLSEVKSVNGCPLSSSLLSSRVEDLVDEGHTVVVVESENVSGDLDEERVENAVVPLLEDVGNLWLLETETSLEDIVGLADELHVSVLDTVVDHLDVMSCSCAADPLTARLVVGLGSGLLENLLEVGPCGLGTSGHDRGSVTSTLLTTGDTSTDEEESLLLECLCSSDGVWVV